jgi:hypothetical protein
MFLGFVKCQIAEVSFRVVNQLGEAFNCHQIINILNGF